jgi:SMC interacting uncharacterized protein involved in chromosome segregation
MSVFGDALGAIKDALKLADDVKRVGQTLAEVSKELRSHDRRITRLEAKWETAVEIASSRARPGRLENKG